MADRFKELLEQFAPVTPVLARLIGGPAGNVVATILADVIEKSGKKNEGEAPDETLKRLGVGEALPTLPFTPTLKRGLVVATATVAGFMIAYNAVILSSTHVDPSPTAARQFLDELDALPAGSWVYTAYPGTPNTQEFSQMGWYETACFLAEHVRCVGPRDIRAAGRLPDYRVIPADPGRYRPRLEPVVGCAQLDACPFRSP